MPVLVPVSCQTAAMGQFIVVFSFFLGMGYFIAGVIFLKKAIDSSGTNIEYHQGWWRMCVGLALMAFPWIIGAWTFSI